MAGKECDQRKMPDGTCAPPAGRMNDFATVSRNRTRRGMNEQVSAWQTCVEGLPQVHERLARMVILSDDAINVIRKQDGEKTLFYCDPPYLHETRKSVDTYEHEMTEEQHTILLDTLSEIDGKFILSGYRSRLYDQYARKNKWRREDFCETCGGNLTAGDKRLGSTICATCIESDADAAQEVQQIHDEAVDWNAAVLDDGEGVIAGDLFVVNDRKPKQDVYLRFSPKWKLTMLSYVASSDDDGRDKVSYIAMPHMSKLPFLQPYLRKTVVTFGIDSLQMPFVWLVRLPETGVVDARVKSVMQVWQEGCDNWIQVRWKKQGSIYLARHAEGDNLANPVWPEGKSWQDWLAAAFPGDRVIKQVDHHVIRRLRGLEL